MTSQPPTFVPEVHGADGAWCYTFKPTFEREVRALYAQTSPEQRGPRLDFLERLFSELADPAERADASALVERLRSLPSLSIVDR